MIYKTNGSKTAAGLGYESPQTTVIGMASEGVLCASGDDLWYEKGGSGDFTYGTDTDSMWG